MTNEISDKKLYFNSQMSNIAANSTSNDEVELLFNENNSVLENSLQNVLVDNEILTALDEAQDSDIDEENKKDGLIEPIVQGQTGDCWLLAGVDSLSYNAKGQEIIKNALEYHNDKGYTVVHFAVGDYVVYDSEYSSGQKTYEFSSGDEDMAILECAAKKALNDYSEGKFTLSEYEKNIFDTAMNVSDKTSSIDAGYSNQIWYFLTGNIGYSTKDSEKKAEIINDIARNNETKNNTIATVTINSATQKSELSPSKKYSDCYYVKDVNGEKHLISDKHTCAIKSATDTTVTYTNPWNTDEEVTLDKDTFMDLFDVFYYTKLGE